MRDSEDTPLADFDRLSVGLDDLQPLRNIMRFGQIDLDGLTVDIVRKPDGATNLTSLAMNKPAAALTRGAAVRSTPAPAGAQATPAAPGQSMVAAQPSATLSPNAAVTPAQTPAAQPTAAQTPAPAASSSPADISFRSLTLTNGTLRVTDKSVAPPAAPCWEA